MLTHRQLLRVIAEEKKHTFISTGMSTINEIKEAVNIFREYNCPFELQHSNSSYPMDILEANLRCIETLRKEFNCNVGYSGHESIGYLICVAAVVLGATSIERHITIDRSMYGSDQAASLEPLGLERLVRDIRRIDLIMGDGQKRIWPSEIQVMKKLRYVS
jgi:N-acetylneuraminate synthase